MTDRIQLRDERGRFRKKRYEEFSALEKLSHDFLRPFMLNRQAQAIYEQITRPCFLDVMSDRVEFKTIRIRFPENYKWTDKV